MMLRQKASLLFKERAGTHKSKTSGDRRVQVEDRKRPNDTSLRIRARLEVVDQVRFYLSYAELWVVPR
jgi:hypothetical protein